MVICVCGSIFNRHNIIIAINHGFAHTHTQNNKNSLSIARWCNMHHNKQKMLNEKKNTHNTNTIIVWSIQPFYGYIERARWKNNIIFKSGVLFCWCVSFVLFMTMCVIIANERNKKIIINKTVNACMGGRDRERGKITPSKWKKRTQKKWIA